MERVKDRQVEEIVRIATQTLGIEDKLLEEQLSKRLAPVLLALAVENERLLTFRAEIESKINVLQEPLHPVVVEYLQRARAGDAEELFAHAQRMEEGIQKVIELNPSTKTLLEKEYIAEFDGATYNSELARDGRYRFITEYKALVRGEGEIYHVGYSCRDHPELGIDEGFNVYGHLKPESYDWVDSAHAKGDGMDKVRGVQIWRKLSVDNEQTQAIIGVALVGMMADLASPTDGRFLDYMLPYLNPQSETAHK